MKTGVLNVFMLLMSPPFFCKGFAVKHSLRFYMTSSSGVQDLPEFMAFATFDDVKCGYCDSCGVFKAEKEWAIRFLQDNPQQREALVQECERFNYVLRSHFEELKQQMNQAEGVHTLQRIKGCAWDDETKDVAAFLQHGYDGEDFITFDFETSTWVADKPQALITKHNWDRDLLLTEEILNFYSHICPEWLKAFTEYWKRFKKNPALPSVSLLQKTPSSPVSCHVTGFSPDKAVLFWRRDGQEVHEEVQEWEILPNPDGTFQWTVELNIALIKAEDWSRYECVFHLSGVQEEMVTRLDRASIRTNWVPPTQFPVVAVIVPLLLLVALCISGLFLWRRRRSGWHYTIPRHFTTIFRRS